MIFFAGRGFRSALIALATLAWWVYAAAAVPWLLFGLPWPADLAISLLVIVLAYLDSPKITHVGIVADRKGLMLLFESTTMCRLRCFISGKIVRGGQAHPPADRIADYDGRVYRRRLVRPLESYARRALSDCALSIIDKPYSKVAAAIAGTRLLKWWLAPMQFGFHKFCSYFVAHCLKRIRRFPISVHSGAMSPAGLNRRLAVTELFGRLERLK